LRLRLASAAAGALAAVVAAPAHADPRGFSFGVASGEVRSTSAFLWARPDAKGLVKVHVALADGNGPAIRRTVKATRSRDLTVRVKVRGLRAGTQYRYRFRMGKGRALDPKSELGEFTTAPSVGDGREVRFAWSGDTDAQPAAGQNKPFYNDFDVYKRMTEEHNDFNVNLGDTIYSDSEVPGGKASDAITLDQKWGKYRQNLALPALSDMRTKAATYSHWDDHEFYNDFSPAESHFSTGAGDSARSIDVDPKALYKAGSRAFVDYAPVTLSKDLGLYRSFRWGKNLEFFLLDERSFRSAKASANHTCDNPDTGQPDLAPTSQGTPARTEFGLAVSSLRQPVAQECLDTINDPNRTMLGAAQYKKFTDAIKRSDATFKVVLNEVGIQQYYANPYDRWEGYAGERKKLLTFLRDNVKNVVILTTDEHANFVNDARFQTLEQGGPVDSGITEYLTGPVATLTFAKEIDEALGLSGAGMAVNALVFKAPPPQGVGMRCASPDVYSYGQVSVTEKKLTIALKDLHGDEVKEPSGGTCGPYTVDAK
jgi:phosphodiesterase/alkaline phosphatase D-like protein